METTPRKAQISIFARLPLQFPWLVLNSSQHQSTFRKKRCGVFEEGVFSFHNSMTVSCPWLGHPKELGPKSRQQPNSTGITHSVRKRAEADKGGRERGEGREGCFLFPFIPSRMKQQSARFMKDFQPNLKLAGEARCQWNARARRQQGLSLTI